jgi:hypothetical protein
MLGDGRDISIYHISSDVLESYVTLELESTTTLEFGVFYVAYLVESLSYIFLILLLNGLKSFSRFMFQYFLLVDSLSIRDLVSYLV